MKRSFTTFTFLLLLCYMVNAQSADTSRIVLPVVPAESKIIPDKEPDIDRKRTMIQPDYLPYDDWKSLFPKQEEFKDLNALFKPKTIRKNPFHSSYVRFVIPTAFIAYGVATRTSKSLQKLDQSTHHEITEHLYSKIPVDDYLQFVPAVAVYGLDMAGLARAKHSFRDRTIVMATSHLIMGATVQTMKQTMHIERPDGSSKTSFPSGHTATAFVGAHMLCREYDNIPVAVGGYAIATATGVLRVLNKKHWVSDVVTGAGIGILSVEAGYLLLPTMKKWFGIKDSKKSMVIVPAIDGKSYGVSMAYRF